MINRLHVYELPDKTQERIYCRLDEKFRKNFFLRALKTFNTKVKLAKTLGIGEDIVYGWINGKNIRGKKRIVSISVKNLFTLAKILVRNFNEVEKNIISIKAKGPLSKEIMNPKLPINLNYEMGRLIGISLGDGYITKTGTIIYSNTEDALINEAKKCAQRFGDVYLEHNKKNNYLLIPAGIGLILNGVGIPLKAKTKTKIHIPRIVFNGPKEFQFGVISGLFDDEASVIKDGKIVFEQNLENVVKDAKKLLNIFDIETSDVKKGVRKDGRIRYSFNLRGGVHIRKYLLKIGLFKHPKKIRRLENIAVKRILKPRKGTKVPILYK